MAILKIQATEEQTNAVRARLHGTIFRLGGIEPWPGFRDIVSRLPELDITQARLPAELMCCLLDAFVDVGVAVPLEIWHQCGVAWAAPRGLEREARARVATIAEDYCRHDEPRLGCEIKCGACGDECRVHDSPEDGGACHEDDCTCTGWIGGGSEK